MEEIRKEIEDIKRQLKEHEQVFIALFGLANYNIAKKIYKGDLCNGSTADFDSAGPGSNPGSPTKDK